MKKVFIGVLAALMLFAFVACDNSTPVNGMVYSLEATQNAVYVDGETPTAAGFSFTGYTNMGATMSVDAADVKLVKGTEINEYGFTYKGIPVEGSVIVDFEDVTGLKVDASDAVTVYYASLDGYTYTTARTIDKTGLVVTAEYEGGTKVLDNKNEGISVKSATLVDAEDWEAPANHVVTVEYEGYKATYNIEIVTNLVEKVETKKTSDYIVYFEGTTPTASNVPAYVNALSTSAKGIYLELTYQGGETKIAQTGEFAYVVPGQTAPSSSFPSTLVPNVAGNVTFSLKYTGKNGTTALVGTARESAITVEWVKKAPVSVEMTTTPSTLAKTAGSSGPATGFEFSVKNNDGTSTTVSSVNWWNGDGTTPTGNYITLAERTSLANYTVDDRYVFHITGSISGLPINNLSFEAVVSAT